jgi:hypothetical protein
MHLGELRLETLHSLYSIIFLLLRVLMQLVPIMCRLRQVLLQPEEELLVKRNAELSSEGVAPKPKKLIGKMKVQGTFLCYFLLYKLFNFSMLVF